MACAHKHVTSSGRCQFCEEQVMPPPIPHWSHWIEEENIRLKETIVILKLKIEYRDEMNKKMKSFIDVVTKEGLQECSTVEEKIAVLKVRQEFGL